MVYKMAPGLWGRGRRREGSIGQAWSLFGKGETRSASLERRPSKRAFRRSYIAAVANWFGNGLVSEIVFLDEFDYEEATSEAAPVVTVGSAIGGGFLLRYRQSVGTADATADGLIPATRGRFETPERALMLEYRLSEIFTLQGEAGPLDVGNYLNMDLKMEFGY